MALVQDAMDLLDRLQCPKVSVVGHDWGARTAYALGALFPQRLHSVSALSLPFSPGGRFPTPSFEQCRRWWYQFFMTTDRGAAAVRANPKGFSRQQWETWSRQGWFADAEFEATAKSFENPDWLDITLNAYRSRWKAEPFDERYAALRERLSAIEKLSTPTLMIQGSADMRVAASESEGQERYFSGGYRRELLVGVGHFPAREAPNEVARAVVAHIEASFVG